MTTMLEENFNQLCNVTDRVDYGYEDAPPDTSTSKTYGYGDDVSPPDKYGYGVASPTDVDQYGYGDGSPEGAANPYGYGDASPNDDAAKYGYGDTSRDDVAKYGYGDASTNEDVAKSGHGDGPPNDDAAQFGYGDASPDGPPAGNGDASSQPTRRARRRNSVTRYSIVAQDAVKHEFVAHANAIDQLRQGLEAGVAPPAGHFDENFSVPLKDAPSRTTSDQLESGPSCDHDGMSYDGNSGDDLSDDGTDLAGDKKDKSKKKRRGLGRFRIGRTSSTRSKDSAK